MLLSGFTFVRNARRYDFPIAECVHSMLPLVDELVLNVGRSEDGTEDLVEGLAGESTKIRIVRSVWDDAKTERGLVLSEQTNLALDACSAPWALYLQADEALHEAEHALIRGAVEEEARSATPVDGFRLRYLHFYSGYSLIQRPWNWYPSEIRVVRRDSGARSFGDAQTFRGEGGRGLRTRLLDAHVYHYGHARRPEVMERKIHYFHRFWHGDRHGISTAKGAYAVEPRDVVWFWGTHPAPYAERAREGAAWSVAPAAIAARGIERVLILAEPSQEALAEQLRREIEATGANSGEPSRALEVTIFTGYFTWICHELRAKKAGRRRSAVVDLRAERRSPWNFISWIPDAIVSFAWRVAHAPEGRLPRWRARFYSAVNWGRHEKAEEGFRVPESQHARQLARWLGIEL